MNRKNKLSLVVLPAFTLLLSSCYFNSSGHIFDAASHNAAVNGADVKVGQTVYSDGKSYYMYLPRYRYDEKVVTQYSVGGKDDEDGKRYLTPTKDMQFVQVTPALATYYIGEASYESGRMVPADEDIADNCKYKYTVKNTTPWENLHEFEYTSAAAPLWYTLGVLNVICVDIPISCVENSLASVVITLTGLTPGETAAVTEMHSACREGDYNQVLALLNQGVDVDMYYSQTPLMIAAQYGHADICRLLLSRGADINALSAKYKNNNNVFPDGPLYSATALHYAAINGHTECAKVLCEHNVLLEYRSQSGVTALQLAEERGHTATAVYLRSLGAHCEDYRASIKYYEEQAAMGDAVACAVVGCYYFGEERYKTAFPYLLKGAESGHKYAIYYLGLSYFYGYGVIPNDANAKKWLGLAISKGIKDAQKEYKQL